jgi:hypothetical protein
MSWLVEKGCGFWFKAKTGKMMRDLIELIREDRTMPFSEPPTDTYRRFRKLLEMIEDAERRSGIKDPKGLR